MARSAKTSKGKTNIAHVVIISISVVIGSLLLLGMFATLVIFKGPWNISMFVNTPPGKVNDVGDSQLVEYKGDGYTLYIPQNYSLKTNPVLDSENKLVFENEEKDYIPDREHLYFSDIKPLGFQVGIPKRQTCEILAKDRFAEFSQFKSTVDVSIAKDGTGVGCKISIRVISDTDTDALNKKEKILWRTDDPQGKLYIAGIRYIEQKAGDEILPLNQALDKFILN